MKIEIVPPPAEAPLQSRADALGLPIGLRVETSRRQWRCCQCSAMQPPDTEMVWVPDSVKRGDPAWSVTEAARENAYNGNFSAWCLKCARKFKVAKSTMPLAGKRGRWLGWVWRMFFKRAAPVIKTREE